jgi:LysR family hca operon transcriptional activator
MVSKTPGLIPSTKTPVNISERNLSYSGAPEKYFVSWNDILYRHGSIDMDLRHLRYFIAVAETGSLTAAAEQRLHTAQPSLSRQIRDPEAEVGVQLLIRGARGVGLTAAGRAFLDHARMALAQAEAATEAARRVAHPAKPVFALGFLTGQEIDWLPEAMRVLRDVLPEIEVTVSSQSLLADALTNGKLDLAFMRAEPGMSNLTYQLVIKERLVAVLPSDHRLASLDKIDPRELVGETVITVSSSAPTLSDPRCALANAPSAPL